MPKKSKSQKPKNLRVNEQSFSTKGRSDFIVRSHKIFSGSIFQLLLVALVILSGVVFIVYHNTLIGAVLLIVLGFSLLIYATHVEHYKRLLTKTEFLTALFSSVVGSDYKFCMVVNNKTGEIVYLNKGFQQAFPKIIAMPDRKISDLLETYDTGKNSKTILDTISKGKEADVKTDSHGTWLIEPIARPAGFSLIRGK